MDPFITQTTARLGIDNLVTLTDLNNEYFLYTQPLCPLLIEVYIFGNYYLIRRRVSCCYGECSHWDSSQVHARKSQLLIDGKYISLFKVPWGSPGISFPNCERLFAFNLDLVLLTGIQMATPPSQRK